MNFKLNVGRDYAFVLFQSLIIWYIKLIKSLKNEYNICMPFNSK